jgi:hypothetical protein
MTTENKLAIFALSNKGGVGKTMLAKAFTDYLRDSQRRAAVFDTDGDVKGLLKLYGRQADNGETFINDPMNAVGYFDMQVADDRENIINATEAGSQILFFDTPAGSIRKIFTGLRSAERFVRTFNAEGYKVVLMLLVDPYDDTIDGIQTAIDLFGETVDYVVWKNMAHAERGDFVYFEPTSTLPDAEPMFANANGEPVSARELVETYKGQVFEIPDMPLRTNARIRRHYLRFREATKPGSPLKPNDRALARDWLAELDRQFEQMLAKFGV